MCSEDRISKDEMFLQLCFMIALRGTCKRRKVGCILVDKRGHVISTGYNGNASGMPHCIDSPCAGANLPSGTGLDECEAIHAEQNALIQCTRPFDIDTVYCTDSPCVSCVKLLMGTSARRIVFVREYPHSKSRNLWLSSQNYRIWMNLQIPLILADLWKDREHIKSLVDTYNNINNVIKCLSLQEDCTNART